ncbi:MAG: glycosyltransferase, exosortase A system-associated [Burkholderiales bacterium]|nr:glycosyltransferase, exosortase A system-associated [Burkholderiales bacterium]
MKLRILHVLDHSLPLHSGYTFRTLSILREQRKLGWETLHLTTPKQGADARLHEDIDGLRFYRTPSNQGVGLLRQMQLTARRIAQVAAATRPHLIHAHSPALNALPMLWVGRRMRLPTVYEMRASWEDAAVDHGTTVEGSLRYRASRALETLALRHAGEVTTICDGLRQEIAARGIASERITVIPNAVDVESFRFNLPCDPQLRSALGLDGALVLGFVGSFYHYEGLHLLLQVAQRMLVRHPQVRVLLVGGGPEEGRLRAQAAALGLQDRVLFTGRVAHAEVERYYALIDMLVYPRLPLRLTDLVTPLKPLEAMAQGKLVVASDVGGHRELIRHGETGVLFDAGDAAALERALYALLAQPERWSVMRDQARRFVEVERTWSASIDGYRAVYQRAMQRRQDTSGKQP